jgi:uncharacterized membrane protein (UPF0127 family)
VRRIVVERAGDGSALWAVEVADSWFSRLRGLIGRHSPARGTGLYFPGTNSIHMLFMRYPIDCVFVGSPSADGGAAAGGNRLDEVREVLAVRENLRPWTGVVWWVRGARGAIELAAGGATQAGVGVGDRLRFSSAEI